MAKIKFTIITLFPEALQPYLSSSMLYKAQDRDIISVDYVNLRDFGLGPHRSVDDTPYGGGDGMLLRPEPVFAAIENIKAVDPSAKVILPTPVGRVWDQTLARAFADLDHELLPDFLTQNSQNLQNPQASEPAGESQIPPISLKTAFSQAPEDQKKSQPLKTAPEMPPDANLAYANSDSQYDQDKAIDGLKQPQNSLKRHFIILCPHYEGYDERIMTLINYPISLGNYVLTGGELPALVIIDSITRLLPGVLGGATSALIESFSDGDNLEYPQYTKPADFRGLKVPEILLSGNHGAIAQWRADHSRPATAQDSANQQSPKNLTINPSQRENHAGH